MRSGACPSLRDQCLSEKQGLASKLFDHKEIMKPAVHQPYPVAHIG